MAKKKSALSVKPGVKEVSSLNPALKLSKPKDIDVEALYSGIRAGDTVALSRGITLIESAAPEHRAIANALVAKCRAHRSTTYRIGFTGVPGVGKSTFIEQFGVYVLDNEPDAKMAVLAIDPSSERTKGSILGDKTRMEQLSAHSRVFIRPSATAGALGGVARGTHEAIVLCEAAGYTHIVIETVGVGQSEVTVKHLVDCFLFLSMPGTGDELQGIKRGIMEMADIFLVNKSDQNPALAKAKAQDLKRSLVYIPTADWDWKPAVFEVSGQEKVGFEALYNCLDQFFRHSQTKGWYSANRAAQNNYWFEEALKRGVEEWIAGNSDLQRYKEQLIQDLEQHKTNPFEAASQLLDRIQNKK